MMLSSFVMLILAILLYNIFYEVNSAGVPHIKMFPKMSALIENSSPTPKLQLEYLNQFDYKLETLSQMINKMDNSIQNLQEKSQTWSIFQHQINSWNEGIRSLESKLDILKRTHEDQQQELLKLELAIDNNNKINDHQELLMADVKQFLNSERKTKNELSSKMNNILRQIQGTNDRNSNKMSNIMSPMAASLSPNQHFCSNTTRRLEQRLNTIAQQMALQKDLKQLNSLERRNSKSLENLNQILCNSFDKQEEITIRLQKSNECCHSLSSELTTFTESSDILLKRIEKLVRSVSEKLNDIEAKTNGREHSVEIEDIEIESDETEREDEVIKDSTTDEKFESNEDLEGVVEQQQEVLEKNRDKAGNADKKIDDTITEYDDSHDFELIRPNLNGCHELLQELTDNDLEDDSTRVDGIYKFSSPDTNEDGRDFNERYCVFPHPTDNDTGIPWTVIQRRGSFQQQENFNRSWSEYRNGFGHLSRDFWFGNEFIHRLVYHDDYELRIELEDFEGVQMWAEYAVFRLDSEKYNYNLLIGEHRGALKDAMKYHNDNDFSTYDRRNDKTVDACCSCAMGYASGWWFDNCSEANLNGLYHNTPLNHNYIGIMWELWHGDYSLKKTSMMIRPRNVAGRNNDINNEDYHEYTEDP